MGSLKIANEMGSSALSETTWGYLLQELQIIWDEVGEDQPMREKVMLELEQECLDIYRRKVGNANILRAQLNQQLVESEAELTRLLHLLGERSFPGRPEKMPGTLKEQLNRITPAIREMQLMKEERVEQFRSVQEQIHKISAEIAGKKEYSDASSAFAVDENDLSLKKLEEYQNELQRLLSEKRDRIQKVEKYMSTIKNLSATLGMDSSLVIGKVHPSLNISDEILENLDSRVKSLESEKQMRLESLQKLGKSLVDLWNVMETPYEDRQPFLHVINLSSMASADISSPGSLTLDIAQQAEAEVKRLDQLKARNMKEFFLRKKIELEKICKRSHMEIPSRSEMEKIINQIKSGEIDHDSLLTSMDELIARAQEEAASRKVIMDKVEKWLSACNEERWLEEYSRDENRYSTSRGAHKNLKRAERARVMVNKIPDLVNLLLSVTRQWEEERKKSFWYDEVPLLAMLEEYIMLIKEKEEEKQRQREQKKTRGKVLIKPERPYGSRPSTSSRHLLDKSLSSNISKATMLNRKFSLGSNSINSPNQGMNFRKAGNIACNQKGVAHHPNEDTLSVLSSFSGPHSP